MTHLTQAKHDMIIMKSCVTDASSKKNWTQNNTAENKNI